ncbi:MAG: hypothetical protein ACXWLX_10855 [Rhizomicrobium sp.]
MTRKITMKPLEPLNEAEQDFAALADQWIDRNWHLPPSGDHSWREREAQRIFGCFGKEPINDKEDPPPLGQVGPMAGEVDGACESGFRRAGALNLVLPISLATCITLFVVAILAPETLTSSFWDGPKALSDTPVRTRVAPEVSLTPNLAFEVSSNHDKDKIVSQTLPQQVGQAAAPTKVYRKMALPLPRPPMSIITKHDRRGDKFAVRVANAHSIRQAHYPRKLSAISLPPIGADYFARHAPAVGIRKSVAVSLHPIGEAYFESHSTASAN